MRGFSLYIHIPYCSHKCPYCDFNTYAVSSIPEKEYTSALLAELDYQASQEEWRGRVVNTIYFGGGTPSLFSSASIRKIICWVCSLFPVNEALEVSVEANPGTLGAENLKALREVGVNRLSVGAQSFSERLLKVLGRIHSPEQVEAVVTAAKDAFFGNVNIDLMYGIPGQTMGDLKEDLQRVVDLGVQHVSAYGLTIEKGTPFYVNVKKGFLVLPEEEVVVAMMEEVDSFLPARGYQRYEISNFSKPGKEAKHNMAYWNGDDYLGLGAGAHSFLACYEGNVRLLGNRWANFASPDKYMESAIAHGRAQSWREELSKIDLMFEYFFLGLRKTKGVSVSEFTQAFGMTMEDAYPALIDILTEEGLVKKDGDFLSLTEKGMMFTDNVVQNFAEVGEREKPIRSFSPSQNIGSANERNVIAANE